MSLNIFIQVCFVIARLSEIFELGMVNSSSDNVICWFITKSGYRHIGVNKNNFIDFLGKYIVEEK